MRVFPWLVVLRLIVPVARPRDQRLRSSIYVETPECSFVVDTGTDFRTQALRENSVPETPRLALVSVSSVHAQIGTPAVAQQPPKAIYTPGPVYRPEWAKQGLAGKGVVLVTIDQQTGKVTGARMLESTGNKQLDGAALEAYSQWRFQPGTGSQVKIPIEFASRPKPPVPKRTASQPAILYPLLILLGFGVAVIAMRTRRRSAR